MDLGKLLDAQDKDDNGTYLNKLMALAKKDPETAKRKMKDARENGLITDPKTLEDFYKIAQEAK